MLFVILALILQPPQIVVTTGGPRSLDQRQVISRDVCLPHTFEFALRNSYGIGRKPEVLNVSVDGRDIPGAAAALQVRAADRSIERIGLLNCGEGSNPSALRGYMELSPFESTYLRMEPLVGFWIKRMNGEWRLEF